MKNGCQQTFSALCQWSILLPIVRTNKVLPSNNKHINNWTCLILRIACITLSEVKQGVFTRVLYMQNYRLLIDLQMHLPVFRLILKGKCWRMWRHIILHKCILVIIVGNKEKYRFINCWSYYVLCFRWMSYFSVPYIAKKMCPCVGSSVNMGPIFGGRLQLILVGNRNTLYLLQYTFFLK